MKKLNLVCIMLAVVSLVAGGAAVLRSYFRTQPVTVVSSADTAPQVALTIEHLYEVIEPCEKLVTATDNYGNTSTVSDCAEVFGHKVPFTTDTIRFSYTGTIYVGIDLSTIGLDINEASRNIYITLQSPDVIAHDIDPASFVFTTERDGLITEITPEEFIAKAEQLKTEQEAKAEQDGSVFKNAKVYAETAISKLIKAVPETRGYDLKFFYE